MLNSLWLQAAECIRHKKRGVVRDFGASFFLRARVYFAETKRFSTVGEILPAASM